MPTPPPTRPLPKRVRGPRQLEPTLLAAGVTAIAMVTPDWVAITAAVGCTAAGLVVRELRIRARVRDRLAARAWGLDHDEHPEPEHTP